MSRFDERRKQLGINSQQSKSAFERRREQIEQQRERERQQSISKAQKRAEGERLVSQARANPDVFNPMQLQQNVQTRFSNEALNRRKEELANQRQDRAMNSGLTKALTSSRDFLTETLEPFVSRLPAPKSDTVGRRVAEGLGQHRTSVQEAIANNPVGAFVQGAGDAATLGLTSYGERMLGNPNVADRMTESAAGRAGQVAGSIVLPAGRLKAGASLLSNIGRGALGGGLLGAGIEAGEALTGRNNQSLGERALDVGIGAALGGAGAGAIEGIGRGLQAARGAAQDVVRGNLNTASAIESAAASVPTGRLRVQNNTERLSRLMGEIKPVVTERMTPPLENPRELARWLKPHLGDVSLNDINKLSYDDMVELASEVQRSMRLPDVAAQVARERGQDLNALLDNRAPNFRQRAEQLRMGGVAGAIEPPQNVRVAIRPSEPLDTPEGELIRQNWFGRLFGDQNVGFTPFGSNKSDKIVTTEQQIVNNHIINSVKGTMDQAKQAGRAAYQNTVDFLSPLKTINRKVYDTAMDAARANNIANTIVRDKFVDNQGNVIGSSLNDIMRNTRGLGKRVDDYLILRHAETRMKRGERVYDDALGMTPEKARQAYETLEKRYPELKRVGEEWDAWNTNILDNAVKEGLISQAARDAMRTQNPHYASMRRQFSTAEKLSLPKWGNGGSAFSGQSAPIKEVSPTGSTRKIVSPLRSAIEQAYAWKNAELRNRTMQEIVKAIQTDPQGMKGIAEIVKKPSTSFRSLDEALRKGGSEEFLEVLESDYRSLFKPHSPNDDRVVRAMVNGNPVYVKIHNPEAAKALLGMGSDQAGIILKTMQVLSDATKRGATGLLAPMFAVKSLTGDTAQAAIQSPNAFKHIAVDVPYAALSSIADVFRIPGLRNLAQDFRRTGGEYSALLRGDRKLNTSVSQLRREAYLSPRGVAKGAVSAVKAPFRLLEGISDRAENLNRMAAFSRAMKGKERTPENVRNAINAARESTVNFSRRGALSQQAESIFPYQNAAIQSMFRIGKAFYRNPIKTLAGMTTLVVAPKLYEYARFHDDPDYQRLPARERYRNLIISKNADGTFNKLYMPPEYMAFGAFLTDVLNDVIKNDPEAYKGTLDAIVNAFTPPLVSGGLQGATQGGGWEQSVAGVANSTVLGPAASVGFNQSFTGAPIVPQRLQNRSPELQYDERTSAVGKKLGEVLKMSPMKVDYIIRAYGGDPARLLLPLTSDVGAGNTRNTLLRNFIVDPVFTNTLADDYYTAREALQRARADHSAGREFPEWYSEDVYKLATSTAKGSPGKKLSELNAEKRTVQGDGALSAQEKTQKLRDIQRQINEIYIDVNSRLRDAGVPMPNR